MELFSLTTHAATTADRRQRPLRFGVMSTGTTFPAWQAQAITALLALDNVHLALLIIDDQPTLQRTLAKLRRLRPNQLLFRLYRKCFVKPRTARPVDMTEVFAMVPALRCRMIRKGTFSQYFSDHDVHLIKAYDLDFILHFGFNIIRGEILEAARYGVWSFHHDDEEKYRGQPPCFWEIYHGDPITGAILQRLTPRLDGGVVLKKGLFSTADYSYTANLDRVYGASAAWPAQVCRDIRRGTAAYLQAPPSRTAAPIYHLPTNRETLQFLGRMTWNILRRTYRRLFLDEDWNIGIVPAPIHVFLESAARPEIRWLPCRQKGQFIADPFGIQKDERVHLFFELYDYRTSKGIISHLEITDETGMSEPQTVIALPVHMSYPYVLEHEGEVYCIPQISQAREISLYKAECFPHQWRKVATLVENICAVDPTVFEYEGRWWLFCTEDGEARDLTLFVWHAPDLLGPWEPHAGNPIKTDIRSSRSAGTPFIHHGALYRPAQDCSRRYGGRITLHRVTRLTPTEFKEEQVGVIQPDPADLYPDGLHTVSAVGNMTVIDGLRLIFVSSAFKRTLVRAFTKVTKHMHVPLRW